MSTSLHTNDWKVDRSNPHFPSLTRHIDRLGSAVRLNATCNGLARLILLLTAVFWGWLILDQIFEFVLPVRVCIFIAAAVCFAVNIYAVFRPRRFHRETLAAVLEHYIPQLKGTLLTVLKHQENAEESMLQCAAMYADAVLRSEEPMIPRRFFRNSRIFAIAAGCCIFAAVSAVIVSVFFYETAAVWASRNLLLSQQEYPRRSLLIADGFTNGTVLIAKGDAFTLTVRADMTMPRVPDTLKLRVNSTSSVQLTTFNTAGHYRFFTYTFSEVLEPLTLTIRGADSTLSNLHINVADPPILTDIKLQLTYPAYMHREPKAVPVIGRTMIPDGTNTEAAAVSSKPLAAWKVDSEKGKITFAENIGENHQLSNFKFQIGILRQDKFFDIHLTDTDNLRNKQPIGIDIGITKDLPPVINARLDGIGQYITPNAVLPIRGEITDDYGIQNAELKIENGDSKINQKLEIVDTAINENFQLPAFNSQLQPKPGDKLTLYILAADECNLDIPTGQTSESQRWTLDVVTPEKLKTILEVRETTLRQRYEVVIGEVERTKTMLGDLPKQLEYTKTRMLRDTQKEVLDQQSITEGFNLIRQEMFNNKIFSDEEHQRLDSGIITPLRDIINTEFPRIDKQLESFNERDTDSSGISRQFDTVLDKMKQIRDRMISLESFNEAVELLRALLKEQQQIRGETIQERKDRLKDLLKE